MLESVEIRSLSPSFLQNSGLCYPPSPRPRSAFSLWHTGLVGVGLRNCPSFSPCTCLFLCPTQMLQSLVWIPQLLGSYFCAWIVFQISVSMRGQALETPYSAIWLMELFLNFMVFDIEKDFIWTLPNPSVFLLLFMVLLWGIDRPSPPTIPTQIYLCF